MKILLGLIVCLFALSVQSADLKMNKRHGHLIPLDGRGTNLYIGYWDFLKKVTPKSGYGLSSVYIWPGGFKSLVQHLSILKGEVLYVKVSTIESG
jgi:hypothetical protein